MSKNKVRLLVAAVLLSVPVPILLGGSSCGPKEPPVIESIKRCPQSTVPNAEGAADEWCRDNTACPPNEEGYCPDKNTTTNGSMEKCYTICSVCGCKISGMTDPNFDEGEVEIMSSPAAW